MDNFKIDITAEGESSLAKAIEIAFAHNAPGGKATHYSVVRLSRVTSYHENKASEKLPANVPSGNRVHHFSHTVEDKAGCLTLILHWSDASKATPLPFPLAVKDAIEFVKGWLANASDAGKEPDHDGSNGVGWRVFTEDWGHVAGHSYAVFAVQCTWAMYGK